MISAGAFVLGDDRSDKVPVEDPHREGRHGAAHRYAVDPHGLELHAALR